MELIDEAGLSNYHGTCGIEELKKIQDVLSDYKMKLFSKEHFCAIIFEGVQFPRRAYQILQKWCRCTRQSLPQVPKHIYA
uniref:Uncharacterized protein n=1 Tax=Romanomermis culicivorax TaxID=13658 RepID=A0A915KUA1_ROMCU